jgi:hypothetical protein
VFVSGIVVEDHVDHLARRNIGLDGVQETDELLMAMALHAAVDDRAVEHIEGGKERGRTVSFVVVRHGSGTAPLHWQSGLGVRSSAWIWLFSSTDSATA